MSLNYNETVSVNLDQIEALDAQRALLDLIRNTKPAVQQLSGSEGQRALKGRFEVVCGGNGDTAANCRTPSTKSISEASPSVKDFGENQ